ncbi:hypothetical protein NQZ68_018651 [Dissostichus eleginoides]|nr:hypothetical protein NQZ68_018651 [Dissostichus eleginoides]
MAIETTQVRNRLTNVRVEKLVGIRANLRLFEPDTEPSSTRLDSDTEEEDSELDLSGVVKLSIARKRSFIKADRRGGRLLKLITPRSHSKHGP